MRLARGNTIVVWLALVALVGQLLISFAHSHVGLSVRMAASWQTLGNVAEATGNPRQPSDGGGEYHCPVCWALAGVGAGIVPAGEVVVVPAGPTLRSARPRIAALSQSWGLRAPFQARAPPFETLT